MAKDFYTGKKKQGGTTKLVEHFTINFYKFVTAKV